MRPAFSIALFAALLTASAPPSPAQWIHYPTPGLPRTKDGKPSLSAPAPKDAAGHPDLSGIWQAFPPSNPRARSTSGVGPDLTDYLTTGGEIPMLPSAAALFKARAARLGAGRPSERCLPHAIPDAMILSQFKIVQTPGLTMVLFEEFNHYRQIFTDGRPLPESRGQAWFGYSIGKWEGDTFVVESRGFNDKSWLDDFGHPHTEALHTTERFRRRDLGHMDMAITIDDPQAYKKPWTAALNFGLIADTDLIENICENEKDAQHAVGK